MAVEPEPKKHFGFPEQLRLKSRDDFSCVFKHGQVVADDTLVMHGVLAETHVTRLGLSVSKKVGNAPVRNRWKRLIREAFRCQRVELAPGLSIVVRPRKGGQAELKRIQSSLVRLSWRMERKLNKRQNSQS